ncbi:MAG: LamG domain-containing protein [Bacteroidota bacterium]
MKAPIYATLFSVLTLIYPLLNAQSPVQALQMEGYANWIDCGPILPASYTKEAWIKLTPNSDLSNPLLSSVGFGEGHLLWMLAEFDYRLAAGHNGRWDQVIDSEPLAMGWHHVALTYDAHTLEIKLYKNGKLISLAEGVAPTNDPHLQIGSAPFMSHLAGTIDEVRIWSYARRKEQINQTMRGTLTGNELGLVAYYPFSQGSGMEAEMVLDETPHHHHGTLKYQGQSTQGVRWVAEGQPFESLGIQTAAPHCQVGNWQADQVVSRTQANPLSWGQEFISCEPIMLQQIYLKPKAGNQETSQVIHLYVGTAEEVMGQDPIASSYYTTTDGHFMFQHIPLAANQPYTFLIENLNVGTSQYWVSNADVYLGGTLVAYTGPAALDGGLLETEHLERFPQKDLSFVVNPSQNQVLERSRPRLPVHARSMNSHHRTARLAGGRALSEPARRAGEYRRKMATTFTREARLIGQIHGESSQK